MRFEELYARRRQRILTMAEAAEMLGVTERTFRRWSDRYEKWGQTRFYPRKTQPVYLRRIAHKNRV